MTDVEKYGLFALVIVAGILGLIVMQGSWEDEASEPRALRPVVVRAASASRPAPAPRRRPPAARPAAETTEPAASYTVRSVVSGKEDFDWREAPVSYPGPRSAAKEPELPEGTVVHQVCKGETLSDISVEHFGTSTRWRDILALNPGLEPRKIRVGDRLVVRRADGERAAPRTVTPPRGAAETPVTDPRFYTVQKGDTLSEIAQQTLGSAARSGELFAANRDRLASPDALKVGQSLRIP